MPSNRYYIITGVSSGIGAALAHEALSKGRTVFGISRNDNPELHLLAKQLSADYHFYPFDLRKTGKIADFTRALFQAISPEQTESVTLINNAGALEPIGPLDKVNATTLHDNLEVNLVAPLLLVAHFIQHVGAWRCKRTVVTISSGAANYPYEGLAGYCTAKAGVNRFTECVGLEQQNRPAPVIVTAIAPGVVDTPMQAKLRSADARLFPMQRKFEELKNAGHLSAPREVALKLIAMIESGSIETGQVLDIR